MFMDYNIYGKNRLGSTGGFVYKQIPAKVSQQRVIGELVDLMTTLTHNN